MLHQVLHEIEQAKGPITLNELSRKLNVEPSALLGMIEFWVRKGRLRDDEIETAVACAPDSCHDSCGSFSNCAFVAKMPRSYTLRVNDKK